MLRCELERVRPPPVLRPRGAGDDVLRILATSRRPLTDMERGQCMASVMILMEEITRLRRSIRQCNRSITNAQKRARNVVYI